jgi:hypothetical protein
MKHKLPAWIQGFLRWLFGAPFEELPPEFGNSVPAELRLFQARTEEAEHRPWGSVSPISDNYGQSIPPRDGRPARREQFK